MAIYDDETAERPAVGTQPNQAGPARDADLIEPSNEADEDEDLDEDDIEEDFDSDTPSQERINYAGDGGINDGVAGNTVNLGKSINDSSPGVLGGSMGGGFGSGA